HLLVCMRRFNSILVISVLLAISIPCAVLFIWQKSFFTSKVSILSSQKTKITSQQKNKAPPENSKNKLLKQLRAQFGPDVKIEIGESNRLVSIRASKEFRFQRREVIANEADAIRRAEEILGLLRDEIGIRPESPLSEPVVRLTENTALVYFQQTLKGLPVAPFGQVTVQLDLHGGLNRLDSDYLSGLRVENEISGVNNFSPPSEPMSSIVWVAREYATRDNPSGKYAYQYVSSGVQVVIDAQTGVILFQKNRTKN
ncbi:MAG: hypothetical protein AABZ55_08845, partial [Bdellovibrionota bacterium]